MSHPVENRNNEIVSVNLSIGQIRLLEKLLDAELSQVDIGTSFFNENALKAVFDVFYTKTIKTHQEENQAIENWVNKIYRQRVIADDSVTLPLTADVGADDDSGDWRYTQALGVHHG